MNRKTYHIFKSDRGKPEIDLHIQLEDGYYTLREDVSGLVLENVEQDMFERQINQVITNHKLKETIFRGYEELNSSNVLDVAENQIEASSEHEVMQDFDTLIEDFEKRMRQFIKVIKK